MRTVKIERMERDGTEENGMGGKLHSWKMEQFVQNKRYFDRNSHKKKLFEKWKIAQAQFVHKRLRTKILSSCLV